jgi:hypothetical protein
MIVAGLFGHPGYVGRPSLEVLFNRVRNRKSVRDKKIVEAVEKCGYSQVEVARYLNLRYTTVSRLVNRRSILKTCPTSLKFKIDWVRLTGAQFDIKNAALGLENNAFMGENCRRPGNLARSDPAHIYNIYARSTFLQDRFDIDRDLNPVADDDPTPV